ncbi:hypothetical protein M406DRAFT_349478 [Cryphonectria parasitica EP155]|uniref:Uncharacterized protein n=1 Tax=Cryphonectria parasitica (strain ATCC 38755 / EP155) TaxID=660469 RepID=A0A9P5CTS5_CRYP1|nr:uncharacterized protein M406DRAFT_349478 [Cryphonectria parasitica EP155]KAF3770959.1 hypothetical protein M406DRAFT_349478 [Cryphonectria parasitica EP155]
MMVLLGLSPGHTHSNVERFQDLMGLSSLSLKALWHGSKRWWRSSTRVTSSNNFWVGLALDQGPLGGWLCPAANRKQYSGLRGHTYSVLFLFTVPSSQRGYLSRGSSEEKTL